LRADGDVALDGQIAEELFDVRRAEVHGCRLPWKRM
jgi:hypothetical protein